MYLDVSIRHKRVCPLQHLSMSLLEVNRDYLPTVNPIPSPMPRAKESLLPMNLETICLRSSFSYSKAIAAPIPNPLAK
jgi:hypothetical protein